MVSGQEKWGLGESSRNQGRDIPMDESGLSDSQVSVSTKVARERWKTDRARVQRGRSCLLSFTSMGGSRARGGLGHWGTEWIYFPQGRETGSRQQGYTQPSSASMELGWPKAIASLCPTSTAAEAESPGEVELSLHVHLVFSAIYFR